MSNGRIRVLIADDHPLVREGLKRLVDEQPDMAVVAETSDGIEAARLCLALQPDVALVDVSMPVWDGPKLAQMLRVASPRTRIISVSRHSDASFVRKMTSAGAVGYVLKQSQPARLIAAIRLIASGGTYIDPSVRDATAYRQPDAPPTEADATEPLTTLEEQVLKLAAASESSRQIADRLAVHRDAVTTLKTSAMAKLGLRTRLDLVSYGRRRGWVRSA